MVTNMANTQNQNFQKDIKGKLSYDDKVIQKIIGMALENVDGLLSVEGGFFSNLTGKIINTDDVTKGVAVEVGETQVAVDLKVITEYRKHVPEIYKEIKRVVSEEVERMTDLNVVEVNVDVVDIKTKEQQKADDKTLQDKVTQAAKATGSKASDLKADAKDKLDNIKDSRVD